MSLTLYEKAMLCEAMMEARHDYQGMVRWKVLLPPAGAEDFSSGSPLDDAIATGTYLGAQAFRYALTRDPYVKRRAKRVARGLRMLQRVTRSDGCFARTFKRASRPTWDEALFGDPREWHQAGKYRWYGDASTDSLVGIMFGYQLYYDLVADPAERAEVARDVEIIMDKLIRENYRITDPDGRMTMWGNMCPLILEENLQALELLSHLRGAYHITKKRRFLNEYHRLIDEWDYHKKAALANTEHPAPWDWNLAFTPIYTLLQYEKDPALLRYYYQALDYQWKGCQGGQRYEPFFNFCYKVFRPKAPIIDATWAYFERFEVGEPQGWCGKRPNPPKPIGPVVEREVVFRGKRKKVRGIMERAPREFLRAYWMGRYYGFIPESA